MARRHSDQLEVRHIRFSVDFIDEQFDDKKKITDVLSDLQTGLLDIKKLPIMSVVKKGKLYFTLDNSLLWVLKQYAQSLEENKNETLQVPVKMDSEARLATNWLTTTSEGEFVEVKESASCEVQTKIKTVELSEVRYSSDCIYGENTGREFDKLFGNIEGPGQLPVLKVVKRKDVLYALNNEQLWMIKEWYRRNFVDTERNLPMSQSTGNEAAEKVQGATGNSEKVSMSNYHQDGHYTNMRREFKISVELRPYTELPEYFNTSDAGKSIEFRNKKPKKGVVKYRALTRQESSQEKRSLMKYGEQYKKQSKRSNKFS